MENLRLGLQILAGFIFLFQSFRLLREEYREEQVVKASVVGVGLFFGFTYLSNFLNLNLRIFYLVLSLLLTVLFFEINAEWRFWYVVEKLTWPALVSLALAFVGTIEGVVYLLAVLASFYWRNYRNFLWYPSGKVGFFFLINLIFIALFHLGLDFWQQRLIELSVWSIGLLGGISGIVLLSGREQTS